MMVYSQELTDAICARIAQGATNEEAALLEGISEETFYNWQRETNPDGTPNGQYHPEFSESLKKANSLRKLTLVNRVLKASNRSWQAAAWYLERRYPREFGIRMKFEHDIVPPEERLRNIISSIRKEMRAGATEGEVSDANGGASDSQTLIPESVGGAVSNDGGAESDL